MTLDVMERMTARSSAQAAAILGNIELMGRPLAP